MPKASVFFVHFSTAVNRNARIHEKLQLSGRSFAPAQQGHHFTINKYEYFTVNKYKEYWGARFL
jgi:hypothetical protein